MPRNPLGPTYGGGPGGGKGDDGLSAYDIAVLNGFVGSETQWLASLKGAKGDKGDSGSGGGTATLTRVVDDRCIVTRGMQTSIGALSNGTDTGQNSRVMHKLGTSVGTVRLVYFNGYRAAGGPNTIAIKAYVERSNGKKMRVTFNGDTTGYCPAGTIIVSDPVPVFQAAGSTIYEWNFVEARTPDGQPISGGKWPRWSRPNTYAGLTGEGTTRSVGEVESTAGSLTTNPTELMFYSAKIIAGSPVVPVTSVGVVGDSIATGSADSFDYGMFTRVLTAGGIPFINVACVGELAVYFTDVGSAYPRWRLLGGSTHAWVNYMTNDLNTGRNAAQIKGDLLNIWRQLVAGGTKVRQTTGSPLADSTDNFATLTNQTPRSSDAARQDINAWLRDGAPLTSTGGIASVGATGVVRAGQAGHPLHGVDDTAAVLEDGTTGRWVVGRVSDALHPSAAGHAAAAAILNTDWLGAAA